MRVFFEKKLDKCVETKRHFNVSFEGYLQGIFVSDAAAEEWLQTECNNHGLALHSVNEDGSLDVIGHAPDAHRTLRELFRTVVSGLSGILPSKIDIVHGSPAQHDELDKAVRGSTAAPSTQPRPSLVLSQAPEFNPLEGAPGNEHQPQPKRTTV